MRKILIVPCLLLFSLSFYGQVHFLDISFEEALKQSKESGRFIFLQFESTDCSRCNEVAYKAFQDKKLASQLNQAFIPIAIGPSHPDRELIRSLCNIKGFGSFFIDQNKTLIHSFPQSSSRASDYKKQVDIALTKAGEDIRLNELEKEYKNGNRTAGMLELILQKRKSLNLETDSLLEEYVTLLPADSMQSVSAIAFIAEMEPVLDSKADQAMRRNNALFNKAWYALDLQRRIAINNRIIFKSRQKAIQQKNERFAYRVAAFARATYSGQNNPAAFKSYDYNMLSFYKGTNDTLNYLLRALNYYDNYYMGLSVDSVQRIDSLTRQQLLSTTQSRQVKRGDTTVTTKMISYAPRGQFVARDINEGAWNLYKMSSDPLYIKKGLQWAAKANSFYESAESLDTWARLLYKSGNKAEAINKQEQAIAIQRKQGYSAKEYENILEKMKSGATSIDN